MFGDDSVAENVKKTYSVENKAPSFLYSSSGSMSDYLRDFGLVMN